MRSPVQSRVPLPETENTHGFPRVFFLCPSAKTPQVRRRNFAAPLIFFAKFGKKKKKIHILAEFNACIKMKKEIQKGSRPATARYVSPMAKVVEINVSAMLCQSIIDRYTSEFEDGGDI